MCALRRLLAESRFSTTPHLPAPALPRPKARANPNRTLRIASVTISPAWRPTDSPSDVRLAGAHAPPYSRSTRLGSTRCTSTPRPTKRFHPWRRARQGGSRACLLAIPRAHRKPHASKRRSEAAPKMHAVTKGQQNKAAGKSTADRKLPQNRLIAPNSRPRNDRTSITPFDSRSPAMVDSS